MNMLARAIQILAGVIVIPVLIFVEIGFNIKGIFLAIRYKDSISEWTEPLVKTCVDDVKDMIHIIKTGEEIRKEIGA